MKAKLFKLNYLIIIVNLLLAYSFSFAQDSDSLQATPQDTTLSELIDSTENWIGYYLFGGAGIIANGATNDWSDEFNLGPAFNGGIELPFTTSHCLSFELLTHSWIARSKYKLENSSKDNYIQLGNDFYSQMGLSWAFKFYLNNNINNFRLSFHFGWLFLSTNSSQSGLEFGFALNYKINKLQYFSLTYKTNIIGFSFSGNSGVRGYIPSVLMLNFYQRFYW